MNLSQYLNTLRERDPDDEVEGLYWTVEPEDPPKRRYRSKVGGASTP